MKRRIVLTVALAMVLVFALGTVALAVPGNGNAGGNNNPLGEYRSTEVRHPFGQVQSEWVAEVNAGVYEWANYGECINEWKADWGFK